MKNQMTLLAFGAKCATPSGNRYGTPADVSAARAMPSRFSMAPSARPVKPMPRSARNARRGKRRQLGSGRLEFIGEASPDRNEVVVVDQHEHQVFARALVRVG